MRRRPPRGGVDRNNAAHSHPRRTHRRPPRGGVDRNATKRYMPRSICCRPPRGGVDRNRINNRCVDAIEVAPRAGAWIETSVPLPRATWSACRPPRGGVDRNKDNDTYPIPVYRRPPRGGVDRNDNDPTDTFLEHVAPRAGAWIETSGVNAPRPRQAWSPPARGRGSKRAAGADHGAHRRSPPARGRGSKRAR